jgi:hypothetical protein
MHVGPAAVAGDNEVEIARRQAAGDRIDESRFVKIIPMLSHDLEQRVGTTAVQPVAAVAVVELPERRDPAQRKTGLLADGRADRSLRRS